MCGLVGYNGVSAPDPDKLKILWMYNLGRGDDSCGIYWDGLLKKGVGAKANVFNFIEATSLKPIKKYFTVIGHTRKSTVGSHTEDNAHPFGFYTEENHKEGKKVGLKNVVPYAVGAHNGIIRNREELRTKYGSKYKYNVDSIELLNILVDSRATETNINVLNDYEGYAALLWSFTDENKLYVFRGKSSIGEDSTGERPLFYWKKRGEKAVYISSIKESLMAICDDDDKEGCIKAFEPNKIHIISDGQISTLKKQFNRESKGTTTSSSSSGSSTTSSGSNRRRASEVFIGYPEKLVKKADQITRRDNNGDFLIEDEPFFNPFGNDRVVFVKGRYHKNGHILGQKLKEGVSYLLDENGNAPSSKNYSGTGKVYHFWNGWLLNSEEDLKDICKLYSEGKLDGKIGTKHSWNFDPATKRKFSARTLLFDNLREGGYNTIGGSVDAYITGKFTPLFNQGKVYEFSTGFFKKCTYTKPSQNTLELTDNTEDEEENAEVMHSAITDSDVDMLNVYIAAMNTVNEASEALADKDFSKDPETSEILPVTESLRKKLVKWLDEAWLYLDEHITKEEQKSQNPVNSETAIVF